MRTLKKTLALVLVIAMVFSLCAMSVSAVEDYKDDAAIENKLAVYTLSEMGILNGMDGENFAPNGTLKRSEAAKIIAYLLGDGEEAAKKTATDFADVDKDYWASGYIAYCANLGIVEGYGDGNFGPEDYLTGYQWLKMVICALGYNATVEGLNGIGWDVMTALKAADLKLISGIETLNKRNNISRDDAAQVAYNALKAATVSYSAEDFIPGTTVGTLVKGKTLVETLGYTLGFGFKADAYGRPATAQWTVKKGTADAVVVYDEATDYVEYTAATKVADVVKTLAKDADVQKTSADSENGDILRLYDLNEYAGYGYEFHLVKTYAWTLAEEDIIVEGYKIDAAILLGTSNLKFKTTEEFEEGDIVLYTLNAKGEVETAYAADSFVGEFTSIENIKTTAKFYVDGAQKELHGEADKYVTIQNIIGMYADEDEWLFIVDEYGYVVEITDVPVPEDIYFIGYLTDYEKKEGTTGTNFDLFDNLAGVANAERFEIVTPENKTIVLDGAILKEDGTFKSWITNWNNNTYGLIEYSLNAKGELAKIRTAEVNNGTYKDHGFVTGEGTLRDANKVADKTALVTSKTVAFVYSIDAKTKDVTAVAYTGYQNIPSFSKYVSHFYANAETDTVKSYKALDVNVADLVVPVVKKFAFIVDDDYTQSYVGTGAALQEIATYKNVYIDGAKASLVVENRDYTLDDLGYTGMGLYEVTYDADGYVTAVAPQPLINNEYVVLVENTYFKTSTGLGEVLYYTDADTVYYQVVATEKADKSGYDYSIEKVSGFPVVAVNQKVYVDYAYTGIDNAVDKGANEFVYFHVVNDIPVVVDPMNAKVDTAAELIEAVKVKGATVTLTKDIDLGAERIWPADDVTIELGEYKIKTTADQAVYAKGKTGITLNATTGGVETSNRVAVSVYGNGGTASITINGGNYKGEIWACRTGSEIVINDANVTAKDGSYAVYAQEGGKITINGGTYTFTGTGTAEEVVVACGKSVVTINGGTFKGKAMFACNAQCNCTDGGYIRVNGGTFTAAGELVKGYTISDAEDYVGIFAGTFNADPSDYLGAGAVATNNYDGTYTVK